MKGFGIISLFRSLYKRHISQSKVVMTGVSRFIIEKCFVNNKKKWHRHAHRVKRSNGFQKCCFSNKIMLLVVMSFVISAIISHHLLQCVFYPSIKAFKKTILPSGTFHSKYNRINVEQELCVFCTKNTKIYLSVIDNYYYQIS